MAVNLNISRLVRVQVLLQRLAAARRGFGLGLIIGESDVIDGLERIRSFATITEVAQVFGTLSPEYKAALSLFSQEPSPDRVLIGRWLRTPTHGILRGGALTPAEQNISNFNTIPDAGFRVLIDGVMSDVTMVDLTAQTTLNGIAALFTVVLAGLADITWTGSNFVARSLTTGATSTIDFLSAPPVGTNISGLLKLTSSTAVAAPVPGYDSETPLEAVVKLSEDTTWYACGFAYDIGIDTDVTSFIQAAVPTRTFWESSTDLAILDANSTTDMAYVYKAGGFSRTFLQYTSVADKFPQFSAMARLITTNFDANNTMITLMYKNEPTVVAEHLTTQQADTLQTKRCNVFAQYDNDTAIIQYGVMCAEKYADEAIGLDWLAEALQTACYNLLYQSTTKVPQTDGGQSQLINVCTAVLDEGVNNGLIAPGRWNGDPFGQLARGDFLTSGYYLYSPPLALQDQSIREQRISQPIQIAVKLAGAIHELDIIVNVNR